MYHLSKPQKLVYDMEKYAGGSVSVICGSVLLKGNRELDDLKCAVDQLYEINAALRMKIKETADGTMQTVSDYVPRDTVVLQFEDKVQFDALHCHPL